MAKNNLMSAVKCLEILLLVFIFCGRVTAQPDTFNILLCDKMRFDEVVGLKIEVKNKTISIPKKGKNAFVHPLKYISDNDTNCVVVIELNKSVFRLYKFSTYMQSSSWEFCFPQRRRFKKSKKYWFSLYHYGGYGIMQPLRYEESRNGKAIFSNKNQ